MSLAVSLHHDAAEELEAAAQWYDDQRQGLGSLLLAAVDRTIQHIRRWPQSSDPIEGAKPAYGIRQASVSGFPYRVAYVVRDGNVLVLAVAHEHRRPGYWRARRPK